MTTPLKVICGFKDIYDRLNSDNLGQYPLINVEIKSHTEEKGYKCANDYESNKNKIVVNGNQRFIPRPKSIQINQDIIHHLYNAITDEEDTISEVPIYFVVLKTYMVERLNVYTHISLFIYFKKKWFSITVAQCNVSYTANLLTPDNIFNTITHELFVIDFGVLNKSHIEGINEYIKDIDYNYSYYNEASNYYTYNLKKYYERDIKIDSLSTKCSKFILDIFIETIHCSTKDVVIGNFSRINTNLVDCESISLDMKITDFLQISAGSSNSLSYYICKFTSMLRGGSSVTKRKTTKTKNKKNKHKRKRTNKTYKK